MFIYGLAQIRCTVDGCKCACETSSKNGECTMTDHYGYNLYASKTAVKQGEVVITMAYFCSLQNILGHDHSY